MSVRVVKLGDIAIQDRKIVDPASSEAARRSYLGLEQIDSGSGKIISYQPASEEGKSTTFSFDARHVLYGKLRPYLNKVALPEREGRCSTEIIPFLPNLVDREFLAYLLRSDEIVQVAMADKTGSRMPRADMDTLLRHEVVIPQSLDEQRRIAAHLKLQLAAVEEARQAAQARQGKFAKLRKAFFAESFPSQGKGGRDWPVVQLRDVANIAAGITLGKKTQATDLVSVPYLRVANVQDGRLNLSEVKTVEVTPREIEKLRLEIGDLLLTEGGDLGKRRTNRIFHKRSPAIKFHAKFFTAAI